MQKTKALEMLGGITATAEAIGASYQAIWKWPETLSPRLSDRVHAAVARQEKRKARKSKANAA